MVYVIDSKLSPPGFGSRDLKRTFRKMKTKQSKTLFYLQWLAFVIGVWTLNLLAL